MRSGDAALVAVDQGDGELGVDVGELVPVGAGYEHRRWSPEFYYLVADAHLGFPLEDDVEFVLAVGVIVPGDLATFGSEDGKAGGETSRSDRRGAVGDGATPAAGGELHSVHLVQVGLCGGFCRRFQVAGDRQHEQVVRCRLEDRGGGQITGDALYLEFAEGQIAGGQADRAGAGGGVEDALLGFGESLPGDGSAAGNSGQGEAEARLLDWRARAGDGAEGDGIVELKFERVHVI